MGFIVNTIILNINDVKLYKNTLIQAKKFRIKKNQLIIHSDNGYQYTSIFLCAQIFILYLTEYIYFKFKVLF